MPVVRAAFDLGSSHHKLVVAATSPGRAPTILLSTSIRVALADALTDTQHLPASALLASRLAFHRLHTLALSYRPAAFTAVATAVFRTARNGQPHLAALPVRVHVLDADTEGALAFASATVAYPPCARRQDVVVWDSGGASTQWAVPSEDGVHVRAVTLGSSSVRAVYREGRSVERLRGFVGTLAGEPGCVLASRLERGALVVGIGSDSSMFGLAAGRKGDVFSEEDVWEAVEEVRVCGGEQEMAVLPKLVLLAELMALYRIDAVRYVKGNGNCVGLLASEDERLWGKAVRDSANSQIRENPLAELSTELGTLPFHIAMPYSSEVTPVSASQT